MLTFIVQGCSCNLPFSLIPERLMEFVMLFVQAAPPLLIEDDETHAKLVAPLPIEIPDLLSVNQLLESVCFYLQVLFFNCHYLLTR